MVAVVVSSGLGLASSSKNLLGGAGTVGDANLGRSGDRVYVNAVNGNLVIQGQDELLVGRGLNAIGLRTYNSAGQFTDDNGDNWTPGVAKSVTLTNGPLNGNGSIVTRRDGDGTEQMFVWDSAKQLYASVESGGMALTLQYGSVWTFLDGNARVTETYSTANGRLLTTTDANGNTLTLAYSAAGLVSSVTTASGEITYYDYNANKQLTQLRTLTKTVATGAANVTSTRVRYTYDTTKRLQTVTVDLSPDDNAITDGKVFTTTYTYIGATNLIASLKQSDGVALNFTYDGNGVKTVTDANGGVTSFVYRRDMSGSTGLYATEITDPLKRVTTVRYDILNNFAEVSSPSLNGVVSTTHYNYVDPDRGLFIDRPVEAIDAESHSTKRKIDDLGNAIREEDASGRVIRRSYSTANRLLAETVPSQGEPAATAAATRYVYDSTGGNGTRLRFLIGAEGRVTEYRYDATGLRTAVIQYAGAPYAVAGLNWSSVPTDTQMASWVNAQDKTRTQRQDFAYDWRGQLTTSTAYASTDAAGNGVADGKQMLTQYVYDRMGLLLKTVSNSGATTQYTYDGLGRLLTVKDALNQVTTTVYDDLNNRVQVTLATGLVTTSSYDKLGRLVSVAQTSAKDGSFGTTTNYYTAANELRMTQDATGARTWYFYDDAGRKAGEVNALGQLSEYSYNKVGQVTQTLTWGRPVNTAGLVDVNGAPTPVTLASIRPTASTDVGAPDRKAWNVYDAANRLIKTVSPLGEVTELTYDASDRIVSTRNYMTTVSIAALGTNPTPASVAPAASAQDRINRNFYGADGLLIATLDSTGGLTEYQYDAAGRQTQKLSRVNASDIAQVAAGGLTQVRPADARGDARTLNFYNGLGQLVAQLDGENSLTERQYDKDGNLSQLTRYPTALSANGAAAGFDGSSSLATLKAAAGTAQATTAYTYDPLNRVLTQRVDPNSINLTTTTSYDGVNNTVTVTDPKGVVTLTQFDAKSRTKTVTTDTANLAIRTSATYDNLGRVLTSTDAKLAVTTFTYDALGRKKTVTQDSASLKLVTTYAYDVQGNVARVTNPANQATRYVYDADGRLRFTLDADGGLTESRYDALGNVTLSIRYMDRQSSMVTTDLAGGLISNTFTPPVANAARDQVTRYAYDTVGRLVYTVAGDGAVSQTSYDASGQVVSTRDYAVAIALPASPTDPLGVDQIRMRLQPGAADRLTRYAYDALGRRIFSVDPAGTVLQSEFDAFGRLVAQRQLANAAPGGGAMKLWHREGTNRSASRFLGTFKAGDVVTATVRFKAAPNAQGSLFLGDAGGADQYDNVKQTSAMGNDGWQTLTVTHTMSHDDDMWIYIYGDPSTTDDSHFVLYDNARVGSVRRGEVLTDDFRSIAYSSTGYLDKDAWSISGFAEQVSLDVLDNLADAQLAAYLPGLSDPARDLVTRYVYDALDRKRFQFDPQGTLTEYRYDATGLVTSTLTYERTLRIGANLSEAQVVALLTTSTNPFTSTVEGFTGNAGVWEGGRLKLISQPEPGGTWANMTSPRVRAAGTSFKFSITPTQLQQTLHSMVESASGTYNRLALLLKADGNAYAQVANAKGEWREALLGKYSAGVEYNVEVLTNATGASLYFYRANLTRDTALSYTVSDEFDWSQVRTAFATSRNPALAGVTTAYVDNIEDRGPDARRTRYVYDAVGRKRFEIDPLGALTEYRYDGAGLISNTLRYERFSRFSDSPTEAEITGLLTTTTTTFNANVEGFTGTAATWDSSGRIKLTSRPETGGTWAFASSPRTLAPGASYRLELTPTQLMQHQHTYVESTGGEYNRLAVVLRPDGLVYGQTVVGSAVSEVSLGAYVANTTYVVELVTDANGGRAYFYPKTATRATGYSFSPATSFKWTQLRLVMSVPRDPATTTTNAFVDNIEERVNDSRLTRYVYDAAGRLAYEQDPLGGVVRYRYDAAGRLLERTAFAQRIATTVALTTAAFDGAVVATAAKDQATRYVYDAQGRLRFTVDALGGVVETRYDGLGRVSRTIAWNAAISYTAVTNTTTPAALRGLLPASSLNARETIYGYDAAGRLAVTARSQTSNATQKFFSLSQNSFNAQGQLTLTKEYATPVVLSDMTDVVTAADLTQRVVASADDRSMRYVYDAANRVVQATDGEGYTETTAYDAFGNKVRITNKNGATTDYRYDYRGRLLEELSASIDVSSVNESMAVVTASQRLVTRYAYDAFGSLLARTEAAGTGQERTTRYEYDALGRQVKTTFQAVAVYQSNLDNLSTHGAGGATLNRASTELQRELTTLTSYDAFGQAIASRDVSGNFSYKTYDQLGRVVYEVDANRNLTEHAYSALAGESASLIRYGSTLNLVDGPAANSAGILIAAQAVLNQGKRTITSMLDKLGRVTTNIEVADTLTFGVSGDENRTTRETRYRYNVWGDLDAKGADPSATVDAYSRGVSYLAYNLAGAVVREIDVGGYVTDHVRNVWGQDTLVTQYATALAYSGQDRWATPVAQRPDTTPGAAAGFDRITALAYNRRGELDVTTQLSVVIGTRSGTNTLGTRIVNLETRNEYDGAGNLTRSTNQVVDPTGVLTTETGQQTTHVYDTLGRLIVSVNNGRFGSLTRYDALGNAVQSTRFANAFDLTTAAPFAGQRYTRYGLASAAPAADTSNDQVTTTRYDALGRVIQVRDPINAEKTAHDRYSSYDAAGRVVKQWQAYTDSDGVRNAVSLFGYDGVGRQLYTAVLTQRRRGNDLVYAREIADYNGYGEITRKTLQERQTNGTWDAGSITQLNSYDGAGRLWKTTAGGTTKIFWYDALDRVTDTFSSSADATGIDLAGITAPLTISSYLYNGVTRAVSMYDSLGRATGQLMRTADTQVLTFRDFDRWGNLLSVTDNGAVERVRYRYNVNNQVVSETWLNQTYWADDTATAAPKSDLAKQFFYDAAGNSIGSVDAAGNANAAQYNNLGQLLYEYHADGGTVAYGYDGLGHQAWKNVTTKVGDPGLAYTYSYDRADRETLRQVTDAKGLHVLGSTAYDEMGRKRSETTGDDFAAVRQTRIYDYDARGLMWRSATSVITVADYVNSIMWNTPLTPTVTTDHEFTYDTAGNKTSDTDANNKTATWGYNLSTGRLFAHKDIGGTTYDYGYNKLGQITSQTSRLAAQPGVTYQNLAYTYFANGLLKSITDYHRQSNTQYAYDYDGNRTRDTFTQNGIVYRDVTSQYDKQNRLTQVIDAATGIHGDTGPLYQMDIGYDKAGNRRRVLNQLRKVQTQVSGGGVTSSTSVLQSTLQWFGYDAMNRVAREDNTVDGVAERTKLTYYDQTGRIDHVTRKAATPDATTGVSGTRNDYAYDFAGRLVQEKYTELIGGAYDPGNIDQQLTRTIQYTLGSQEETRYVFGTNNTHPYRAVITKTDFDEWGRTYRVSTSHKGLTSGMLIPMEGGGSLVVTTDETSPQLQSVQTFSYDKAGNISTSTVDGYVAFNADSGLNSYQTKRTRFASQSVYVYSYYLMEGYKERGQDLTGSQWAEGKGPGNGDTPFTPTSSRQGYDANGNLAQVSRGLSTGGSDVTWYVTDNAGKIVQRQGDVNAVMWGTRVTAGGNMPVEVQDPWFSVWKPIALSTDTPAPGGNSQIATVLAANPTSKDSNNWAAQSNLFVNDQLVGTYTRTVNTPWGNGTRSGSGTLDIAGRQDTSNTDSSVSIYTAQSGDTARSIAQACYGDSSLWYVIADANGLSAGQNATPAVGTAIKIPKVTRATNTSTSFAVYQSGKVVGNTSPDVVLPPPPPAPKKGCGALGMILVVVVAVVATIVTAGAAAMMMGAAGTGLSGAFAAGMSVMAGGAVAGSAGLGLAAAAIGGAVGSIASQGVAMAMGMQDKFSWKQVGIGAIGSAVTAGMGAALNGTAVGTRVAEMGYYGTALKAAASNALTQGAAVATGLQDKFDWRSVAASAIAAPAAQFVSSQLGDTISKVFSGSELLQKTANSIVRGVVSQRVRILVTRSGKVDYASIAADAFGNAIGESLASQSQPDEKYALVSQSRGGLRVGDGTDGMRVSSSAVRDWSADVDQGIGRAAFRLELNELQDQAAARTAQYSQEPPIMLAAGSRFSLGSPSSPPNTTPVDEMGQPLYGRSNYSPGAKLMEILRAAPNEHDVLGTLGKLANWAFYSTPDAAERRAEVRAQIEGFGNADTMRLDKMRESVLASVLWSSSQALGASVDTSDRLLDIGTSLGGFSLTGAALTGRVADIFGTQRPSAFPTESPYALTSKDYLSSFSRFDKFRLGTQFEGLQGLLTSEINYGGRTATQLYVRAFDGKGGLAPGSVRLDQVGLRVDAGYDVTDFKLSPRSPLTARQEVHYPLLEQYGGVVTGFRGRDIGLPQGSILPPTPVNIFRGPTLRLGN